jgi:hypothetical protein
MVRSTTVSPTHPVPVDGLEVNVVDDGYVIYQVADDRVHYLNATSALIFELCDGQTDVDGIAAGVADTFSLDAAPVASTQECLTQLLDEGVLR